MLANLDASVAAALAAAFGRGWCVAVVIAVWSTV